MEANVHFSIDEGDDIFNASMYRKLIGKLLYLILTRPNISYAIGRLSQFLSKPKALHLQAAQRILSYLKSARGKGFILSL